MILFLTFFTKTIYFLSIPCYNNIIKSDNIKLTKDCFRKSYECTICLLKNNKEKYYDY